MPPTDTSMYNTIQGPQAPATGNLLGMVGSFAQTQNALNQNLLFQQQYKARAAIGEIMQQSIDPQSGKINYDKASVMVSTHPDTAWMAPETIKGWVQNRLVEEQTVKTALENTAEKLKIYGGAAAGVVQKGHDAGDKISEKDIISMYGDLRASGMDSDEVLKHMTQLFSESADKNGKFDGKLAYQNILRHAITAVGSAGALDKTFSNVSDTLGGVTQKGQVNTFANRYSAATGGALPHQPTPGERNAAVTTAGPMGETVERPRAAFPMQTGAGAQAPGTGGAPAAPGGGGGGATPTPPMMGGNTVGATPVQTQSVTPQSSWLSKLSPVQQEQLKSVAPYIKEVNEEAGRALKINQIIDEMDKARADFKSGGGTGAYVKMAEIAQALGVKNPTVDKIAAGSLPGTQEFGKLQLQLGTAMLRNSLMPGAGRILQTEFEQFQKHNPNWDSDPRTIDAMFNFMKKVNGISLQRQNALSLVYKNAVQGKELPSGMADMSQFEPWWNKKLQERGLISGPAAPEKK